MDILIVSPSPLFKDVLAGILAHRNLSGVSVTDPSVAAAAIASGRPRTTLVDEATDATSLVEILAEVRKLRVSRLIFLRQEANDMVVLDSRSTVIGELDDLMEAVNGAGRPATQHLQWNEGTMEQGEAPQLSSDHPFTETDE